MRPARESLRAWRLLCARALLAGGALLALVPGLAGCAVPPTTQAQHPPATPTPTVASALASSSATATGSPGPAPQRYTTRVLLQQGHPDDLALDAQGRLLVSDVVAGTISRVEANGALTLLLGGIAVPEGLVPLADGTLIFAEQGTNRVLVLAPGATTPRVLRALPGTPSAAACKDGVDGLGFDLASQTLLVPDSPTGAIYRLSLDGRALTQIATGLARPVGVVADGHGTIYVADECGAAVWRIPAAGTPERIVGFDAPDDVAFDPQGNLLVTDLGPNTHALIRLDLASGRRETLAQAGLIEPQGLVVDARGDIFLADESKHEVIEFTPAG
jgi:sugar lactone lactonase YvrE